ncbi:type III-B CRISPR module RAMP protein Cmr4 [Haliangium sp.]|uniref:type III-B CRISPR module RAMP protein Cmr4 n=1 Tax=Haliangium sp. TaxID=2663208 RepID=UPI003D10D041
MNVQLWGLLAESPIHVGAGQSTGFVDLPVSREAATDHPVLPGSGLKGALRDLARRRWPEPATVDETADPSAPDSGEDARADAASEPAEPAPPTHVERLFGSPNCAGDLMVSDARLVLLPVRSMTSIYRWVTCPYVIERLARDLRRAGRPVADEHALMRSVQVQRGQALSGDDRPLFLEERQFEVTGRVPEAARALIAPLICHPRTRARLAAQLVVLNDDDFAWFARYGLAVSARNQLDEDRKTSNNLWYEETLPPDSVLYVLLGARRGPALDHVRELFDGAAYLQVGGNETVGHGWLALAAPAPTPRPTGGAS